MKIENTIKDVRFSALKLQKESNNRFAVIVLNTYSVNKAYYGIQFWSNEMIEIGTSNNSDNTLSKFIEKL